VMMLSDVCLSVAYIGPKSRTERPRKTKIGTEVTRTPFSRSKVKVTGSGDYCGGLPHSLFTIGNCRNKLRPFCNNVALPSAVLSVRSVDGI